MSKLDEFEDATEYDIDRGRVHKSFVEDEFEDAMEYDIDRGRVHKSFKEDEFEDALEGDSDFGRVYKSFVEDEFEDATNGNVDHNLEYELNDDVSAVDESTSQEDSNVTLINDATFEIKKTLENVDFDVNNITMQSLEEMILQVLPIRYSEKKLYYYDGYCYQQGDKETIEKLIRGNLSQRVVQRIKSMHMYSEVVDYLRINSDLAIDRRELSLREDHNYISFKNCVVDARSLNVYEHSPDYYLFFRILAEYQENPKPTPCFDQFLEEISGGDEMVKQLIYENIGYVFTHSNDAKAFFVWAKAPDSGKSVLGDLLSRYFDEECIMNMPLQELKDRFALSDLSKKAVSICMDLSAESVDNKSVGMIKMLTGDKNVKIEQKFIDAMSVMHHMRCIFGTNSDIKLKSQDTAFWQRMIIVPFLYSIPKEKQNKNLLYDLWKEKDAIASKAVRAVSKVIKRNYIFTFPEESKRMWLSWSKNTDEAFKFVMDGLIEITGNHDDRLSIQDLYIDYQKACTQADLNAISYTSFLASLESTYGLKKNKVRILDKKNPVSCILGVKRKRRVIHSC